MKKIMKRALSLMLAVVMVMLPVATTNAEVGDTTDIFAATDYAIVKDELFGLPVVYDEDAGQNAFEGVVYTTNKYGAISLTVSAADPGWTFTVVKDNGEPIGEAIVGAGAGSASVDVEPGKYYIKLSTYDTTEVYNQAWDEMQPIGECEGTLSFDIKFIEGAVPEQGTVASNPKPINSGSTIKVEAKTVIWYSLPADMLKPYLLTAICDDVNAEVYVYSPDYYYFGGNFLGDGIIKAGFVSDENKKIVFGVQNSGTEDVNVTINTELLTGVWNNPYTIYDEKEITVKPSEDPFTYKTGVNYKWVADAPGVFTITMLSDEWVYWAHESENHYSNGDVDSYWDYDNNEEVVIELGTFPSESVQVLKGQEVWFWVSSYDEETGESPLDKDVKFKVTFIPGAKLGEDGTVIAPEEDLNKVFENKVKPEKFAITLGENDTIKYINVVDKVIENAVLGADGYYHLNSANGPVLLVDLNSEMASLADAAVENRVFASVFEDESMEVLVKRTNYNNAVLEYSACMDTTYGLYPLTEDLITIYKDYGTYVNWYKNVDEETAPKTLFNQTDSEGETVYVDGDENAWMFACCYVEPGAEVEVLEGKDSTWTIGSTEGATVRFAADFDMFKAVRVDGVLVDPANYEIKEGSIIVTLKADYLKALGAGKHTLTVELKNTQMLSTSLTIAEATVEAEAEAEVPGTAPKTGDSSNIALWVAVLGLGVVAMTGSVVMKKREF